MDTLKEILRDTLKDTVLRRLNRFNDNRRLAAESLGITRRTLYNYLREMGLNEKVEWTDIHDKELIYKMPTNEERLRHADIIGRKTIEGEE
jgi:hypothetical protein